MSKNNSVNFWRVVFTFAVTIFHFSAMYPEMNTAYHSQIGWRIGVEFFFIVSGFLLAYKCERSDISAWSYTKSRYFRLLPEYILMTVIMIGIRIFEDKMNLLDSLVFILNSFDEVLMLQTASPNYVNINGASWYISALVVAGFFIFWLYKNKRELYMNIILPLSIISIYTFISLNAGYAAGSTGAYTPVFSLSYGLLRGFADMSMGVLAYEMHKRFKKNELTKAGSILFTIFEILGYCIPLAYTFFFDSTRLDFIFIPMFTLSVVISFSRTKKSIIYNNPVIDFLSKISYSMYLVHMPILRIMIRYYSEDIYGEKLLALFYVLLISCAVISERLCWLTVSYMKEHWKGIKGVFLKPKEEG